MEGENIYSIIPPLQMASPKGNMHVSKHNPLANPTGSTFGLHSTATKVGNLNGNIFYNLSHSRFGEARDFGYPKDFSKVNGQVSNSIEMQSKLTKLPKIRNTKSQMTLKPVLPSHKPVHGLSSGVDYLKENTDINRSLSRKRSLMQARSSSTTELRRNMDSCPMGKVPGYLEKRKEQLNQEYDNQLNQYKTLEKNNLGDEMTALPEQDLEALRSRLQEKYEILTHLYQSKSHKRFFNTEWEKKRTEAL